jgi:hypothetical protein
MPRGHNDGDLVYTLDSADVGNTTTEHDLPDVDGSEGGAEDPIDLRTMGDALVKIVNNWDQDATFRLEGTTHEDADFSEPDTDVSEVTISSGGGTETFRTQRPWAFLRIIGNASGSAPGSGELKAVWEVKHNSD